MQGKNYLIKVEDGVEPIVCGPYQTEQARDDAAKQIRQKQKEDDGLFWADVDETGTLAVGSYRTDFFWQESREDIGRNL
jgi:hypothetical protein